MKPVLVSGIQPSGRLHLGNYLGALKNFVDLQNSGKYECYFFIADLHSLTEHFDPKRKREEILNLAADFLASGLDPKRSTIYLQSQIPAHSELAWIFSTITPPGELYRMTQFKDKAAHQKQNINVGLLTYPILMAVDILIYDPRYVPVGEDQLQHLELTRTIARKFNKRFGKTFTEPKALVTKTPRLMSLADPTKKMSKSQPATCLFLDDSPDAIRKKITATTTDSGSEIKYDPKKKPGVSNLLDIYSGLSGKPIAALERKFAHVKQYVPFKKELAELVVNHFAEFRETKKSLLAAPNRLKSVLESGSRKAAAAANKKIAEVKNRIGIDI